MASRELKDVSIKFEWEEGTRPAEKLRRAVNSVVNNTTAYFRPWGKEHIHAYESHYNNWSQIPDCPYVYSSLVLVRNLLTTVGGEQDGQLTDKLLSLTWKENHTWEEHFPPMLTKRKNPISIMVGDKQLVVSGGIRGEEYLTMVEVLSMDTNKWTSVSSLPEPIFNASVGYDNDHIYMLGGNRQPGHPTTSVITCRASQLIKSSAQDNKAWETLAELPVERSACACVCGQLLAVGGQKKNAQKPLALPSARAALQLSSSIYMYSREHNSWSVVGDLVEPVSECFAAVLPGNKLMVLGGNIRQGITDRVRIATCSLN